MQLLNEYFALQKKVHEHFGYVEDWKVIPLSDETEYLWFLTNSEVVFASTREDFNTGNYYTCEIYTYRHLPKWVYEAEDCTMVCMDTHTDGLTFLGIFDNSKRIEPIEDLE